MTLLGEPLWVRLFTGAVFVAWAMSWCRMIVKWRKRCTRNEQMVGDVRDAECCPRQRKTVAAKSAVSHTCARTGRFVDDPGDAKEDR